MSRTGFTDFVELLRARAQERPEAVAFVFADGDDGTPVSRGELDTRARAVAAHLRASGVAPGDRALLLYTPSLEYIAGFLGCLYAGVVAVPMFPPRQSRHFERIQAIAADADASVALTDAAVLADVRARFATLDQVRSLRWEATEGLDQALAGEWRPPAATGDSVAFLQYTSGSTAAPKGVMVGHGNLLHNSAVIAGVLRAGEHTRGVSWLPPYHDMGLIGGILQPLYSGFPCLLMSPLTFLHRPFRWLEALSRFGGTVSAAPDFAYAECVKRVTDDELATLDLSAWQAALVGAEPVRPSTLAAFSERFGPAGFRRESLLPCYGLAEATLMVTGSPSGAGAATRTLARDALAGGIVRDGDGDGVELVGCGHDHEPGRVAVVDPLTRRPCAPGTVGEIWVTGPTVAAGYWSDEQATKDTFEARVPGDERAWLRTGDLGFLDRGELYVAGRVKDLIVVRGANHYPQDIETTAEQARPSLPRGRGAAFALDDGRREGVVLVQEAAPGEDLAAAGDAIRAAVSHVHGLALAEVVFVRPGGIPRTSSGKIRRRECRDRYLRGVLPFASAPGHPGTAPQVPVPDDPQGSTGRMRDIVAAVLEREPSAVDPARPLVAQGLDSLGAARLRAALQTELDLAVDLTSLLDGASVATLAATMAAGPLASAAERPGDHGTAARGSGAAAIVPRAGRAGPVPATPEQRRLWLLHELGAGAAYHVTGLVQLAAQPHRDLVEACVRLLVERHESLRTAVTPGADGLVLDVPDGVWSDIRIEVPLLTAADRAERDEMVREWAACPFDLSRPPLVRAMLVQTGDERPEWALALCAHHIAVDGWSFTVLARDFAEAYAALAAGRAPAAPAPAITYRDYAAWLDDGDDDPGETDGTSYWLDVLEGAAPPEIGVGVARAGGAGPGDTAFAGAALSLRLSEETVAGLRRVAADEGATLFMALATGFAAVLARWSGRSDVLFGTALAGRDLPELADLVGLFAGTLPLRVDCGGEPTFRELLRRARTVCLDAYDHGAAPLELLNQRASHAAAGHRPLVRHLLVLQEARPAIDLGVGPAEVTVLPGGAKTDLELELVPTADGGLDGTLVYATEPVGEDTARRIADGLGLVLQAAAAEPDRTVADLPVLSPAAVDRIVRGYGGFAGGPTLEPAVPAWFEAQVDRSPHAPAVLAPDGLVLTYAELDLRANRLANHLRGLGVGTEDRVAVHLHRGVDLIVAILAVLKAGAAYLPLDPGDAPARLRHMLADGAASLTLTRADLADGLGGDPDGVLLLDDVAAGPVADGGRPGVAVPPGNAAYVLYTSGSTGVPKGAVNTHGALANRLRWAQAAYPLTAGDRVLQKTPIGFDVSVWELLLPLVTGATLVFARPGGHQDAAYLGEVIAGHRVTTCHFVPSMLQAFLDDPDASLAGVRRVLCSGEELPAVLAKEFLDRFPGVALLNLYGPTEAAIDVTVHPVTAPVPSRVPIGVPVPGSTLYVLDDGYRPQPIGVPGQLFIGGAQLARGYHGRPALTAERFVPDPFAPGQRMYATGDVARWRPDGTLQYLGRLDHQLKIRGNRVEPGEIEATLLTHDGVAAAVVVPRPDRHGGPFLVAYLVPAGQGPADTEIRAFLGARLPGHMVPVVYRRMETLPRLPNGKIDRSALPPVDPPDGAVTTFVAPRTPVERVLSEIWSEVLGLDSVGVRHDFFELGGHSLMAIRVAGRVGAEFGVRLPVAQLLGGRSTIERLAELVESLQFEQAAPNELEAVLAMVAGMSDEETRRYLADLDRADLDRKD
ncbi:amino acid adenylation domain-containing protein [Nonomuraea sp. NPDC052116]|uniref:amino acid adenylation domain-containing protein n=1 Tax=Nonomuraea sp. NPDC052116 TaxID=3155665 RepID=UPI0034366BD5